VDENDRHRRPKRNLALLDEIVRRRRYDKRSGALMRSATEQGLCTERQHGGHWWF
jgi:hypothetical protein